MRSEHALRLDIRVLPPPDRLPRAFQAFESLEDGTGFLLIDDRYPASLLERFQEEKGGAFDWSVLEDGPEVWRVEIFRRPEEESHGRSVAEYLAWDHDRLDALLGVARASLGEGDRDTAALRFAEFRTGLLRHIRMEEEVLFPAFEKATDTGEMGPTALMRMEHVQIKRMVGEMQTLFSGPAVDPERFESLHRALLDLLGDHNAKEEHVVYPLTDRMHPGADRDSLIRKMQTVGGEAEADRVAS